MKPQLYDSLIALFNLYYDYTKQVRTPDGNCAWLAVDWPKQATHKLICTKYADESEPDDYERRPSSWKTRPLGYAEAVAAIPLKRKLHKGKLKLSRPLPRSFSDWPPYRTSAPLGGKQTVLLELAALSGCYRLYRREIRAMDHRECDAMFLEFIRSSRWLRHKIKKSGEGKGFWKKWNDAHPEDKVDAHPEDKVKVKVKAPKAKAFDYPLGHPFRDSLIPASPPTGRITAAKMTAAERVIAAFKEYRKRPTASNKAAVDQTINDFRTLVPSSREQRSIGYVLRNKSNQ